MTDWADDLAEIIMRDTSNLTPQTFQSVLSARLRALRQQGFNEGNEHAVQAIAKAVKRSASDDIAR